MDTDELQPGDELGGRFRILSRLGQGGMGCVYETEDLELGHAIALKVLNPRYRGRPERERRLLDEATIARRIGDHPALPQLHGSGRLCELGQCPYVAWELVHGRDLNVLLALRSSLEPTLAASCARQLADAVLALHRAGVVHRDVTVTNVFVQDPEGEAKVKLIDLSHAAIVPEVGARNPRLTREIEVAGTHRYMPPEQARARPPHPKMDVFSFGIVLYEMLTGTNPFCHVQDRESYIHLQRSGELRAPAIDRRVYPQVPRSLVEIVSACTRNEVDQRIEMSEVVRRLDDALMEMNRPDSNGLEASDSIEASGESRDDLEASSGLASVAATTSSRWRTRHRLGLAGVLAATAAMIITAGLHLGWTTVAGIESRTDPRTDASPSPALALDRRRFRPPNVAVHATESTSAAAHRRVSDAPRTTGETSQSIAEIARSTNARPGAYAHPEASKAGPHRPSNGAKSADETKPRTKGRRRSRQRLVTDEPVPPPEITTAPETERCTEAVIQARASIETRSWNRVLSNTRTKSCFESTTEWAELRIQALSESGRFEECESIGYGSTSAIVRRFAGICRAKRTAQ